jgi:hypothetical protein
MSDLIERLAEVISPLVRCADETFPHGLDWNGEDEVGSLTLEERGERRAIVAAVLAELDAAGYAIVPKEPTHEMVEAFWATENLAFAAYEAMLAAAPKVAE